MMPRGYDVLIVGAGSAGCVLASRLSEDPARRVLLLEAGPDYPPDQLPSNIANGWEVAYAPDWGFVTEPDVSGRSINAWRGRLVGGCSATNATMALRGHPRDYDSWAERGNSGWSFAEVLPFFRRIETDADFQDEWHGTDGPLPIRRYPPEELLPLQTAFMEFHELRLPVEGIGPDGLGTQSGPMRRRRHPGNPTFHARKLLAQHLELALSTNKGRAESNGW